MKKLFTLLSFVLVSFFLLSSCDEVDEPQMGANNDKIEYYVKYEFKFSNYMSLAKNTNITVVTENGSQSFKIKTGDDWWEGTFGPFNKYQTLNINTNVRGAVGNLNIYGKISISTGGPFVLKAYSHTDDRSDFNLSYKVIPSDLGIDDGQPSNRPGQRP